MDGMVIHLSASKEEPVFDGEIEQCEVSLVPKNNAPGVLVSFEGGDGSGKSTHIRFLSDLLKRLGIEVVCVREPGGTPIGEQLRNVVLDSRNSELSDRAELLIYEAARAQLVDQVIKPALSRGAFVLCDRFIDSTVAYQGYGRGIDLDFVNLANAFATGGVVPDVTVILACSNRAEKQSRVDRRGHLDRIEGAGDEFHSRVIEAFDRLAQSGGDRIRVVETSGTHSQTAQAIFDVLSEVVPFLSNGEVDLSGVLGAYDKAHDHADEGAGEADSDKEPSGR